MTSYFHKLSREDIAFFSCVVIMVSMLTSRYMISVGMILLILNSLISSSLKSDFKAFISNKVMLAITSLFFLYLISGLYSADHAYWLERLRIKLPFLLLPFAFSAWRPMPQ